MEEVVGMEEEAEVVEVMEVVEVDVREEDVREEVIAVDAYENAPAMQVADRARVISMLDGEALRRVIGDRCDVPPETGAIARSMPSAPASRAAM